MQSIRVMESTPSYNQHIVRSGPTQKTREATMVTGLILSNPRINPCGIAPLATTGVMSLSSWPPLAYTYQIELVAIGESWSIQNGAEITIIQSPKAFSTTG